MTWPVLLIPRQLPASWFGTLPLTCPLHVPPACHLLVALGACMLVGLSSRLCPETPASAVSSISCPKVGQTAPKACRSGGRGRGPGGPPSGGIWKTDPPGPVLTHDLPAKSREGVKKWFPRGAGLRAALFWLLGPWVWSWGLDHMQLQMRGGPTHFCFPWVSPQTTQPAFLLSAAVTPRGCGGFVLLSLPPGGPDKEASLYPLLLPLVAWKSLPSNGRTEGRAQGFWW